MYVVNHNIMKLFGEIVHFGICFDQVFILKISRIIYFFIINNDYSCIFTVEILLAENFCNYITNICFYVLEKFGIKNNRFSIEIKTL